MNEYDEIVSFTVVDGEIQVVKRKWSNMYFACDPPKKAPDTVWRETYGVVDGKICQIGCAVATHHPAHNVPEAIIFEDES